MTFSSLPSVSFLASDLNFKRLLLNVVAIFCLAAGPLFSQTPSNGSEGDNAVAGAAAEPSSPASWYGEGVRPTEPRSPQDEMSGFHVPEDFEVRLFAAEPQIAKPMNIAFDYRGRVWVTDSFEYPFPAEGTDAPRDSVRILEDTDGDGTADHSIVFAEGLNIPIGILPYGDGCICFSIPNIYYLRDTDGDDRCDRREVILGPFDTTRDTHGMVNSLRMGPDGWIYANHGFNNQSTVKGSDGHTITMHSGNTFRFLPDGSRVELVTSGQVNPFGRATDVWGYDYTADCHSTPITQLIRGGCYPSFGRPHDGLGFVPPMMDHSHGSTAISGLAYIPHNANIQPLAGQMLSGNVMTSRINRNQITYHGATAQAMEMGDFLTSDDPWFRPVDIRLGPDGFLYVADFYNRIIGHYEVPLLHPGRDRYRGRIWQIRYTGSTQLPDTDSMLEQLGLPADWNSFNPAKRALALQHSVLHASEQLDGIAKSLLHQQFAEDQASKLVNAKLSAVGYLAQRNLLDIAVAEKLLADESPVVRTRLLRILAGTKRQQMLNEVQLVTTASIGLSDKNSHVQRAAAELLGFVGASTFEVQSRLFSELLHRLGELDDSDPVLRQSFRIAIRNLLPSDQSFPRGAIKEMLLSGEESEALAEIMLAIEGASAGTFLLDYLSIANNSRVNDAEMISHMVRHLPANRTGEGIQLVRKLSLGDRDRELAMLDLMRDAIAGKDPVESAELVNWAQDLASREFADAKKLIDSGKPLSVNWYAGPDQHVPDQYWPKQTRQSTDKRQLSLSSSILLGEAYTGTYQTTAFEAPERIDFWLAGHNGMPDQPDHRKNRVRLLDGSTGEVLRNAFPPRSDIARLVSWECHDLGGRLVKIECVDGDNGSAYAWLAVGDFKPSWLEPSSDSTPLDRFQSLVERFKLIEQRSGLTELIEMLDDRPAQQLSLAATVASLDNRPVLATLVSSMAALQPSAPGRLPLVQAVLKGSELDEVELASGLSKLMNAGNQRRFADKLSSGRNQIEILVQVIKQGAMSPDVLLEKNLWDRVSAVGDQTLRSTAERLRATAKPVAEEVQQRMNDVARMIPEIDFDAKNAETLFAKHCASCHQLAGKGQVVGPQLDGIGARGVSRLTEDILLPDRNVDIAFRTTTFLTVSGNVLTGLVRDENESRILLVGQDGKEFALQKDEIEQRREGANSLMPSNFAELLKPEELASVIHFLTEFAGQK